MEKVIINTANAPAAIGPYSQAVRVGNLIYTSGAIPIVPGTGNVIEGGVEEVEVDTPFVVSAAKGMAEQRIPNMMGIMKAKSKPLSVVAPKPFKDLSVVAKFTLPPAKSGVKMVAADNMDELVRLLHEEAKVI